MFKDKIIIFTSGKGQYYHIEAVARCLRDFTETECALLALASRGDQIMTPQELQSYIDTLVENRAITAIEWTDFNRDQTRNGKITVLTSKYPLIGIYHSEEDDASDLKNDLDCGDDDGIDHPNEKNVLIRSHPIPSRGKPTKKPNTSPQRLVNLQVDLASKRLDLSFADGEVLTFEGLDVLNSSTNMQTLLALAARLLPACDGE